MESAIENLEKKPLSGLEVSEACNEEIKIMTYKELLEYNNIDDVFGDYDAIALLYVTNPRPHPYGHWTGLYRHPDYKPPTIEFFDSYGLFIDEQMKFVPKQYLKELRQDFPYLSLLLYESPYEVLYNPVQLQERNKNIASCGRHVVLRYHLKNLPLDKYVKALQTKDTIDNPDEYVTYLTACI